MEKKTKQNLLIVVVGVGLFALLMNFNVVLQFVNSVINIIMPIIAGGILALFINVPMTGIEKCLRKMLKKRKKQPSDNFEPNHKKRTMTKKTSYGIIETIGGFVMARSYRHIQEYEKEILELKEQGLTLRQIGERLGFSQKQVKNFLERYRRNERKIAAGKIIKRKGRPRKDDKYTETDKVNELKYIIARKDAKIKALEMENELMRDFLSHTERK